MSKAATVQVYGTKTNDIRLGANNTQKWLVTMLRLEVS